MTEHLQVDAGEVTLDVAVHGAAGAPLLLMLSGLGAQRTDWPVELLDGLVAAGLQVVTVDNRDVGHSTKLDDRAGDVDDLERWQAGEPFRAPYTLQDMAEDATAVLDRLAAPAAHVLGQSMGGMVAQRLAATHPDRVTSLVVVMSTTGAAGVGHPTPEAVEAMAAATPTDRDAYVEASLARARLTNSPTLFDEARARARYEAAYDRAFHPPGRTRQLLAVLADGDRTPLLASVTAPTLVIHGAEDALVDVSGGRAVAAAIPGARLLVLEEMGHDLPLPLLPTITGAVAGHIWRAELRAPADR